MRRLLPVLLAGCALLLAACGSTGSSENPDKSYNAAGGNQIPANDAADVLAARRVVDAACGAEGSLISSGESAATATGQLGGAITLLTQIVNEDGKDGIWEIGSSVKAEQLSGVVGDVVGQLRSCRQDAAADKLVAGTKNAGSGQAGGKDGGTGNSGDPAKSAGPGG